jgi:nitrogen fixation protein
MKRFGIAVAVLVLLGLMLLPAIKSVNSSPGDSGTQVADGWPLPLPPGPPIDGGSVLAADGWPLPLPPGPPIDGGSVLAADGWPLPLPPGPPFVEVVA